MNKTKHFESRQNQRGISQAMLQVVLAFGEASGDKIILNKKQAIQLNKAINFLLTQRKI